MTQLRLCMTTQWYSTKKKENLTSQLSHSLVVHPPKKNIGSAPVLKLMHTARTSYIAYCFVKVFAFASKIYMIERFNSVNVFDCPSF